MKLLEKNERLPKITMKELEQKIRGHNQSSKKETRPMETLNKTQKLSNLQVLSPFYLRTNKRKQTCECQYHKFKRAFPQSNTHKAQHQQCCSRFNMQKYQQQSITTHLENIHQKESRSLQSTARFLLPLDASMTLKHQLSEAHNLKAFNNPARKSQIISTQNMSKISDQLNGVAQFSKLFDQHKEAPPNPSNFSKTMNEQFIKLINRRLQNNQYKDKYLKTLFGFIKMKANRDNRYIWQSRAYIVNNLNIILNHFKMDQLMQYQQLGPADLQKITSIIKCHPSKTPIILKDLKKVVMEMQSLLEQLKEQRLENDKNITDSLEMNKTNPNEENYNMNGTHVLIKTNQNDQPRSERNNCNNISGEHPSKIVSIANLASNTIPDGWDQNQAQNMLNSFLQKGLRTRRSAKLIVQPQIVTLEQTTLNSQQKEKVVAIVNNCETNRKSQLKTRKSQMIGQVRKSVRVSTLGMGNQNQKDSRFYKKIKKTKIKKVEFPKIYNEPEFDKKYQHIHYEPFCTKTTFIKMINEVQRPDRNNHERALTIFKHLNVQTFIDDKDKIETLITTFKPLFNQQSKQEFLDLIVAAKDRRFIEDLERQLDFILGEIKKNDPRIDDDFYQTMPQRKTQNNVVQFKQHHLQKNHKMDQIIYYEANEQIQRLQKIKKDEKLIDLQLEQANMNEIRLQSVKPSLTKSIYHLSTNKSLGSFEPLPKFKKQKQILRFMKNNHSVNFQSLADSFYEICKSLEKSKENTPP